MNIRHPSRAHLLQKFNRRRRLLFEPLEDRRMLAVIWRNPVNALDVSGDRFIAPVDALHVINELNDVGSHPLANQRPDGSLYLDASGDQIVSPIDALLVINALNEEKVAPYTLTEASQFDMERAVTITVGQSAGRRSYRLQVTSLLDSTDNVAGSEDLFAIYVVDPQSPSQTLLDRGTPGTAVFTLSESGAEFAPGRARWDGQVVELDLSEIVDRDTAILRLQLLSHDSDSGSRVIVRPLSNEVDATGVAGPTLADEFVATVTGAPFDLSGLTATTDVDLRIGNVRFDSATGRYSADLSLVNRGGALAENLAVAFSGLPQGVALVNPSGTTANGEPYLNFASVIPRGGIQSGLQSSKLRVEFTNPSHAKFTITPRILARANRAPTLAPISPLNTTPGDVFRVELSAADPDGDAVSIAIRATTGLPPSVLNGDGMLEFRPTSSDVGQYTFDVVASDGMLKTSQTLTLNVLADPVTTTRVSGQVLGTDGQPLVGMPVAIGGVEGLTLADGRFTLDLGAGPPVGDTLKVRGDLYPGPLAYPYIAEKLTLVLEHDVYANVANVIDRPIYLPALDLNNGQTIDPLQDTTVTTIAIPGAAVFVAAGTLMNQQGSPFTGVLSITQVPVSRTPAALPDNLTPDLVVTIQPGDMVFATPAPLTLPNTRHDRPGTIMDLWSINPATGEFDDVGDARVSDDGSVIETFAGGIRNSSWHFLAPPPNRPRPPEAEPANGNTGCHEIDICTSSSSSAADESGPANVITPCDEGTAEQVVAPPDPNPSCGSMTFRLPAGVRADGSADAMSQVQLHAGTLLETHELASYQSLGVTRGAMIAYDSMRADPRMILHFGRDDVDPTIPFFAASLQIEVGQHLQLLSPEPNGQSGALAVRNFWAIPHSSSGRNFDFNVALQVDLSPYPTGVYEMTLISEFYDPDFFAEFFNRNDSKIFPLHVNGLSSAFGAGWGLAGLQEIVESRNGSALIVDGDGSELTFDAPLSSGAAYESPPGDFSTLVKLPDQTFRRTTKEGTIYRFDDANRLASVTDRHGNVTQYFYDAEGRIEKLIDPVGLETNFTSTAGRISRITDPTGRVTQLDYDSAGNLSRVTDPDGSTRNWEYDSKHHMTAEVDQRGLREEAEWDEFGRLAKATRKDGSVMLVKPAQVQGLYPPEATVTAPYPVTPLLKDAVAQLVDGNGRVTEFGVNRFGGITSSRDAEEDSQGAATYDERNLLTQSADARGFESRFTYDGDGNLIRIADEVSNPAPSELFPGRIFGTGNDPTGVASGDLNADGIADLVTANRYTGGAASASFSVLIGLGDGTFGAPINYDVSGNPEDFALRDMDGDSDLDVVVTNGSISGNPGNSVAIYANDGSGVFGAAQSVSTGGLQPFRLALGDLDGDGVPDIVTAHRFNSTLTITRRGPGILNRSVVLSTSPDVNSVTLADVNSDGRMDVIAGVGSSFNVWLATAVPTIFSPPQSFVSGTLTDIEIADINGDGIGDAVMTRNVFTTVNNGELLIALGNGAGGFGPRQTMATAPFTSFQSLIVADLDDNGTLDVVVSRYSAQPSAAMVFLNQSNGTFSTGLVIPGYADGFFGETGIAVGDFNRDGALDLVSPERLVDRVLVTLGRGDGTFIARQPDLSFLNGVNGMAGSDFDGDADIDLVLSNQSSKFLTYYRNNGAGIYATGQNIALTFFVNEIATGDMNGDGLADLVTANLAENSIALFLGDGTGGFESPIKTLLGTASSFFISDLRLADVDDDSDLDVITGGGSSGSGTDRLWVLLNDGAGQFTSLLERVVNKRVTGVEVADLNHDSLLDVITTHSAGTTPGAIAVFLGNGDGTFDASTSVTAGTDSYALTTDDMNEDGHLDVLLANYEGKSVTVLLGDGLGGFGTPTDVPLLSKASAITTADVNRDGNRDVVVATHDRGAAVLLGDGNGGFAEGLYFGGTEGTSVNIQLRKVLAADVTGDGIVDLVVPGVGTSILQGLRTGVVLQASQPREFTYEPTFSRVTSSTDELGRTTVFDVDPGTGDTRSISYPDGSSVAYTYTVNGLVDTQTDPLGRVTDYDYDALGRIVQVTLAQGTADEGVVRYEYDAAGNRTAAIDENNQRTEFQYDVLNRLLLTRDALGQETHYDYDLAGNLIAAEDARGNATQLEYDHRNRLVEATDPVGQQTQLEYDREGNLTASIDALGRMTRYRYDARDRLIESTDPAGGRMTYGYDESDNLVELTDPLGNRTEYAYDARSRLTETLDALGNRTVYIYDAVDNLVATIDPLGRQTVYAYDEVNRLTSVTDALGGIQTFAYDAADNMVDMTDQLGRHTLTAYDARHRITSTIDPLGNLASVEYDAAGNLIGTTDPLGRVTTFAYDALNRQVSVTDPLANTWQTSYDQVGNVLTTTDPLGRVTRYAYDALDRLTLQTDALDGVRTVSYDPVGNVVGSTDELGRSTLYAYDALDRRTIVTDPLGHAWNSTYDATGNLVASTDPLDRTTRYAYDALNRLTRQTDALDGVRTVTYDAVGNTVIATDELGRSMQFAYDALNRVTGMTDPLGHASIKSYDAVDNLVSVVDAMGRSATYQYDALNRVVLSTDAGGRTLRASFDPVGNLATMIDSAGNTTSYAYDALDRLTFETNVFGDSRRFAYDAVGNLVSVIDRLGRERRFSHDALDRLTGEAWVTAGGQIERTLSMTYDAADQLIAASDPGSSYAFAHDADGRLASQSYMNPAFATPIAFAYAYDATDRRLSRADTVNGAATGTTNYEYDALHRLTRVTQQGAAVAAKRVDFEYDAASQRTVVRRFADLAGATAVAATNYAFDNAGRLVSLSHVHGVQTLASYAWSYDAVNRLTNMSSADGTSTYQYDTSDQLIGADHTFQADESYSYDAGGNRTGAGLQTTIDNRLTSDGTFNYAYDAEGNRVSRTSITTGERTDYEWDYRNQLVRVTTRTSLGVLTHDVRYDYDVLGRRIAKSIDADGTGTETAVGEHYVYDGAQIAFALSAAGSVTHRYLYGAALDEILADEDAAGQLLWDLTDHQGTVRDLIDSQGTIVNHLAYDSYGRVTAESNAAVDHLFGYTGRERDKETGLMYYRARFYDPAVGQFLSEDLVAARVNRPVTGSERQYGANRPADFIDPSGLEELNVTLDSPPGVTLDSPARGTAAPGRFPSIGERVFADASVYSSKSLLEQMRAGLRHLDRLEALEQMKSYQQWLTQRLKDIGTDIKSQHTKLYEGRPVNWDIPKMYEQQEEFRKALSEVGQIIDRAERSLKEAWRRMLREGTRCKASSVSSFNAEANASLSQRLGSSLRSFRTRMAPRLAAAGQKTLRALPWAGAGLSTYHVYSASPENKRHAVAEVTGGYTLGFAAPIAYGMLMGTNPVGWAGLGISVLGGYVGSWVGGEIVPEVSEQE